MFKSILVGTDGSETATEAVRQAVGLAEKVGAELQVVSAYEPVPAQRLAEERRQAPEDLQWTINEREDIDATLAGFLLGSVPNKVSHHAPCSVLIIRTT
jgi:nucleotide-binding universal stress UspA family protein